MELIDDRLFFVLLPLVLIDPKRIALIKRFETGDYFVLKHVSKYSIWKKKRKIRSFYSKNLLFISTNLIIDRANFNPIEDQNIHCLKQ